MRPLQFNLSIYHENIVVLDNATELRLRASSALPSRRLTYPPLHLVPVLVLTNLPDQANFQKIGNLKPQCLMQCSDFEKKGLTSNSIF